MYFNMKHFEKQPLLHSQTLCLSNDARNILQSNTF